ncbi:hypothetical protein DCO48_00045 [Pseudomonas sp. SDI]|uniref:YcaO-like family protein n=1 Tax=Pseudomonas sp. SDI TaxID=2170734 RepID=UPI000DE690DB|nr:YcaO-like family protein [Pseudomonas sp. SDI]PWB35884.1 hypothetical protein DCO48_00045 [Pseudomonas sp. SDI]
MLEDEPVSIPHDYCIKFTEADVMSDTLNFHCKGNYLIHQTTRHISTLHHLKDNDLITLTGNELLLYPDHCDTTEPNEISPLTSKQPLHRKASCEKFSDYAIPVDTLRAILSPLVSRPDHPYKRGYPSAGALYPVELFCCDLNAQSAWPNSHVYHLLPRSRKLESIQNCFAAEHLHDTLLPTKQDIGSPSIASIYFMYLPKALFKYRYRGYRHALLEAGALHTAYRTARVKIHSKVAHSNHPDYLFFQPNALRSLPSSIDTGSKWQIHGSGVGWGSKSIASAMGEFIERRHFYLDIAREKSGTLQDALTSAEANEFVSAFLQTSRTETTKEKIRAHAFQLTKAWRTKDWSPCFIPSVCLSLTPVTGDSDNNYYPNRDTCGCSLHWSAKHSIQGAIQESLERQFLTRFWLTNTCQKILKPIEIDKLLKHSECGATFKHLSSAGTLQAFDISDSDFPGTCIIAIYSSDVTGRAVRYCAGMSYAKNRRAALEKSILELWQTYRFMNLFYRSDSKNETIKDEYLRHFLTCSSEHTAAQFNNITEAPPPNRTSHPLTLKNLISALTAKNLHDYLYMNSTSVNGNDFYACKFLSPNIFLHMNNAANINTENSYSHGFSDKIIKSRQSTMVPFP